MVVDRSVWSVWPVAQSLAIKDFTNSYCSRRKSNDNCSFKHQCSLAGCHRSVPQRARSCWWLLEQGNRTLHDHSRVEVQTFLDFLLSMLMSQTCFLRYCCFVDYYSIPFATQFPNQPHRGPSLCSCGQNPDLSDLRLGSVRSNS